MTGMRVMDLLAIPHTRVVGFDGIHGRAVRSISTDSRTLSKGDVFLAIRGEHFDGHEYVLRAHEAGALACIVSEAWIRRNARLAEGARLLVVKDPVTALGDIAHLYRLRFTIPVLGITGSNGKTGTKDLVAAVLKTRGPILRTEGNRNNRIGLPLTLLALRPSHQAAVVELGTNQYGDIATLCGIAMPTHGLITNIGRSHLQRLHSREGIADEKGDLYRALPPNGVAYLNADEPLLRGVPRRSLSVLRFGMARHADVRIAELELDGNGRPRVRLFAPRFVKGAIEISMRVAGGHVAWMAAAALAVGFSFGCELDAMRRAIASFTGEQGRLQVRTVGGVRIIDDTYNANPDSVIAALETLAAMQTEGRRIAVLGDMLELGAVSRAEHRAVGEALQQLDIPYVFTLGSHARSLSAAAAARGRTTQHFTDTAALQRALVSIADTGDTILVKGSRGMRMDEVVAALERDLQPADGD